MFTNEDFADYVVCVTLEYKRGNIRIPKAELIDNINYHYVLYCQRHKLRVIPLVPIRSIEKMILPDYPMPPIIDEE